jgi:hypothetical protein
MAKNKKFKGRKVSQAIYDMRKKFNEDLAADNDTKVIKIDGLRLKQRILNPKERKAYLQALLDDFDKKIKLDKLTA